VRAVGEPLHQLAEVFVVHHVLGRVVRECQRLQHVGVGVGVGVGGAAHLERVEVSFDA